jgi:membrane protein DedA with SNARE-associated domain
VDPADQEEGSEVAAPARPRPPRRAVAVVGTLIGALVIANNVGSIFTTTLAEDHPAWLLALNSSNRSLGLTTNQLDAFSYYGLGMLRLLVSDPLFFLLGVWYGDAAIRWLERKWASQGDLARTLERWFEKAAYPVVFFAPNNIVCLLAGASGMPLAGFIAANVSGTVARLYIIRVLGKTFESPIERVLDFFAEYRIPLLIVSIVAVGGSFLLDRKRGGGDLEVVEQLEDEAGRDG